MSRESIIAEARSVAKELGLEGDAGVILVLAQTVDTIAPFASPGFMRFRSHFDPAGESGGKARPKPIGTEVDQPVKKANVK